jgi:uncharacterized protein (DUF1697 family)
VPTYVALLRGVNVGGRHRVPMDALRERFELLGCHAVRTHIQSGNVVFERAVAPDVAAIERDLSSAFDFTVPVILRTASEMGTIAGRDPFPGVERSKLHVAFLGATPQPDGVAACDPEAFAPERFAFAGSDLYLYLPAGMASTKLPAYLERRVNVPMTIRNWQTTSTLATLAGGGAVATRHAR